MNFLLFAVWWFIELFVSKITQHVNTAGVLHINCYCICWKWPKVIICRSVQIKLPPPTEEKYKQKLDTFSNWVSCNAQHTFSILDDAHRHWLREVNCFIFVCYMQSIRFRFSFVGLIRKWIFGVCLESEFPANAWKTNFRRMLGEDVKWIFLKIRFDPN